MTIKWDPVLTRAVARELADALRGQRLRAVLFEPAAAALRLYFREHTLDVTLGPEGPMLALRDPEEPPPEARSLACMLQGVEALPDERILRLALRRIRGQRLPIQIIVELAANRPNAVLTEGDDGIVRHVLMRRARGGRTLRVGYPYEPPPPSARRGLGEPLDLQEWSALLLSAPAPKRKAKLLENVALASRINAGGLLGHATREDCSNPEAELARGHELWLALRDGTRSAPCLLQTPWGSQPYPCPLPGYEARNVESLLTALRTLAGERPEGSLPSALLVRLEDEAARATRALGSLERRLRSTPDPAMARALGDLVLARIKAVSKGASRAELVGFDGEPVVIELDPTLSPAENAASYYDRAARQERALERLPELIREARSRAGSMKALLERARAGEVTPDEVRGALPPAPDPTGDPKPGQALPYRIYRSSGGLEIRVGRGAKYNDALTFHHARPGDVWLHARHAAGAHVVLRWDSDDAPPARDLEEAAVLAALYSKARTAGSAPVDWTRRKYVRKPRKAPPGVVTIERVSTVFVEPDPSVAARLDALDDDHAR